MKELEKKMTPKINSESNQADQVFRNAGRKAFRMGGVEKHETGNINYNLENPYPVGSRPNKLWASGYSDERNRATKYVTKRGK